MTDIKDLETVVSRIPLLFIESHEERKVTKLLERFAALNQRTLYVWKITHGLRPVIGGEAAYNTQQIIDACATSTNRRGTRCICSSTRTPTSRTRWCCGR